MLILPQELQMAIQQALADIPSAHWMREAQAVSERYRALERPANSALVSGTTQALGYAALILPATYAQLYGALAAVTARIPAWQPRSLLDLGSGPGTALWASVQHWPSIQQITAQEREPAFIALGKQLAQQSLHAAVRAAHWERGDLRNLQANTQRYDLVILGHVLNELTPETRQVVVATAWELTNGLLLIVEPGTQAAFAVVREARDQLLGSGAQTIAPCAHNQPCPLQGDWCHFPQRLKRPDFQRRARAAPSEWEDAKFSYAAMARFPIAAPIWGRVIREPEWNKAYAEALVSTRDGVAPYRGLKRHKEAFRQIKDLAWGEALDEPFGEDISRV